MENKTYKYNNVVYTLKPATLDVLSAAAPMLAKFRKLQQKYTRDIDMSVVNVLKSRIEELELSIDQLKEISGDTDNNSERIAQLESKLKEAKEQFDIDEQIQGTLTLYNECIGLAMLELIGDKEMINAFLNKALVSDREAIGNIEIDFSGETTFEFVKDVVHDFFCSIAGARKISAG